MSKVQEFFQKVRSRRYGELEMGVEQHDSRLWVALADALEELAEEKRGE